MSSPPQLPLGIEHPEYDSDLLLRLLRSHIVIALLLLRYSTTYSPLAIRAWTRHLAYRETSLCVLIEPVEYVV